ncbi:recombination regulator RecX [Corynebacterium sp. ACRPH]|uniref:recombination regulator RecX n=1 Tax=Corynebacterium sp. ACRPH TaxID=2918199 RepID=UPI001EF3D5C6|nr:recombination regulator RecX [Corynebacterium sp. ACRPH]MCG7456239.1 recombination regulator RecX [Corynebacterium sp. ACRPH]
MPIRQSERDQKIEALRQAIANYSPGEGEGFVDAEEEEKLAPIKAKAVRLINHRARSTAELRQRLLDADFEPEGVEEVIDRCTASGMLDDAQFAQEWVRQREKNQKKSVSVLRRELQRKGIAAALIEDALEQVDEESQLQILEELVAKKAASVKTRPADRKEYDKALRRVVGVAARRGFPQGVALAYARRALDARIEEL